MPLLTEDQLVNPATPPNPWIKGLLDISHNVHAASMESDELEIMFHYSSACEQILKAISSLYSAKNALASETDDQISAYSSVTKDSLAHAIAQLRSSIALVGKDLEHLQIIKDQPDE